MMVVPKTLVIANKIEFCALILCSLFFGTCPRIPRGKNFTRLIGEFRAGKWGRRIHGAVMFGFQLLNVAELFRLQPPNEAGVFDSQPPNKTVMFYSEMLNGSGESNEFQPLLSLSLFQEIIQSDAEMCKNPLLGSILASAIWNLLPRSNSTQEKMNSTQHWNLSDERFEDCTGWAVCNEGTGVAVRQRLGSAVDGVGVKMAVCVLRNWG